MQHSGSVDMNPDIFEIEFFFLKKHEQTATKMSV